MTTYMGNELFIRFTVYVLGICQFVSVLLSLLVLRVGFDCINF